MIRADRNDQVFRTAAEKYKAIIGDIKDCHQRGQPVLVGTTSIENSELISGMLEKDKLAHQVLNAKQHAREAEIVAQAGRPKMITIATNMAGRGTDIVLGGNVEKQIDLVRDKDEVDAAEKERRISELRHEWQDLHNRVIAAGGLHIIGPRGTKRGASTTSCAAAPAGRAIRAPRAFSFRSRTRCCGSSPESGSTPSCSAWGCPRANRSSIASSLDRSRARSARSRRTTSTSASSCWNTTTSRTTSAAKSIS